MNLRTRRRVPLVKAGKWDAVTGPADITNEKLQSMVQASIAPWNDGSVIKIGHFDKRMLSNDADGEPALGRVENLVLDGDTIYGDFVNLPERLDSILPMAYPNRSVEWVEGFEAPDGQTYPAVLKAVSLLGAKEPGVTGLGPIESLEDVYELYAASKTENDVKIAFVGEHAANIMNALSGFNDAIRASSTEIVHDSDTFRNLNSSIHDQGGHVTDTLDAQLREILAIPSDGDLLAAARDLKTKAETVAEPKEIPVETPAPASEPAKPEDVPTPENPTPDKTKEYEETVTLPASLIRDLQRQAENGNRAFEELRAQRIDGELKAASKAGRIAPAEFEVLRTQMLSSEANETMVRTLLSVREPNSALATQALGSAESLTSTVDEEAEFEQIKNKFFGGTL